MAYTFKHGERPLPGYTIQRAVGRGGFGEVYYALADSGKQVALKYLRENAEVELRGIAHVMNLKSPHLITIYDVKKNDEGDPFVVMEYISGPSLHDLLIAEPDGLGVQKTAFFFKGIVEGLSYLHERGIVHRDMKPGNIFFDDGYVKIGDYGLSKHMSVSRHSGQTASVGTVHYMAPEIGSGNYSKAIDIYALGVMLYEMLTGRIPFSGSSMGEILMRHLSDQPDVSGIPEPFATVIAKALAKDPKDRYQDVNEMLDAVISEVDIRDSIGSFDPNTLTGVPRATDVLEPTRTHSPVPPVPPPIPALDARSVFDPETLTPRLRKKAQKLQRKFDKKKAKYEAKLAGKLGAGERRREGQPAPGAPMPAAAVATPVGAAPAPAAASSAPVNRKGQILLLVAVAVGVSMGMAMLDNHGDYPVRVISLVLQIAGATIGAMIAYFGMIKRSLTPAGFMNRAGMAVMAALFMLPGALVAIDELPRSDFNMLFFPIVAMILFCDWSGRIELGRRGHVEAGDAFWPAFIGLIVGAIFDAPALIAAGVCATVSLLTQSAAAMWSPVPAGGQSTARSDQRGADKWKDIGSELSEAANEMARELRQAANSVTGGIQKTIRGQRANTVDGAVIAVTRHPIWKGFWGALSTLALITSVGCFFVLVLAGIRGSDEKAALLYGTIAGVASLPFFLKKAFQKNRQPIWRGTLRFLCISMGLNLAAGMIAVISFGGARGEALGVAIFGLVAGGIVALVSVCIPGPKHLPAASQASAPPEPQPRPMEVVHGATPSFVGRTANAGLSFLGKLFLLTGLFCAICYNLESPLIELGAGKSVQYVSGFIQFEGMNIDRPEPVPPAIVLAPLVLGSIFLVLARRHDGGAHVLRGFTGCALGIVAAVLAVGPAKKGIPVFLMKQDWSALSEGDLAGQVIATGVMLALSLGLLFWPKPGHPRKIVV